MSQYEAVGPQTETPPPTRKWIRGTILGAVLSVVGFATYSRWGRPQVSPVQAFFKYHSDILRRFNQRHLDDDVFTGSVSLIFKEDGADDPDKMTITESVEKSAKPVGREAIVFTMLAQEGKSEDLLKKWNEIKDAVKDYGISSQGDECGAEVDEKMLVEAADDGVTVTFPKMVVCDGSAGQEQDAVAEQMEQEEKMFEDNPPKFEITMSFGRDLDEMLSNSADEVPLALNGASVQGNIAVVAAALDAMGPQGAMFAQLVQLSSVNTISYKKGARFGLQPFDALVQELSYEYLTRLPQKVLDHIKGLSELSDGLKSLEVQGDKSGWESKVTFKNFKISKFLTAVMGKGQHQGGFMR